MPITAMTAENMIGNLVERMTDAPMYCMFCGQGNVPDSEGELGPFLATRLDRNWGDSCYICPPCGMRVGAIFGMQSPDEAAALRDDIRRHQREIHNLHAQLTMRKRRETAAIAQADAALTTKRALKAKSTAQKRSQAKSTSKASRSTSSTA